MENLTESLSNCTVEERYELSSNMYSHSTSKVLDDSQYYAMKIPLDITAYLIANITDLPRKVIFETVPKITEMVKDFTNLGRLQGLVERCLDTLTLGDYEEVEYMDFIDLLSPSTVTRSLSNSIENFIIQAGVTDRRARKYVTTSYRLPHYITKVLVVKGITLKSEPELFPALFIALCSGLRDTVAKKLLVFSSPEEEQNLLEKYCSTVLKEESDWYSPAEKLLRITTSYRSRVPEEFEVIVLACPESSTTYLKEVALIEGSI